LGKLRNRFTLDRFTAEFGLDDAAESDEISMGWCWTDLLTEYSNRADIWDDLQRTCSRLASSQADATCQRVSVHYRS
jgi:hypothetical protein